MSKDTALKRAFADFDRNVKAALTAFPKRYGDGLIEPPKSPRAPVAPITPVAPATPFGPPPGSN